MRFESIDPGFILSDSEAVDGIGQTANARKGRQSAGLRVDLIGEETGRRAAFIGGQCVKIFAVEAETEVCGVCRGGHSAEQSELLGGGIDGINRDSGTDGVHDVCVPAVAGDGYPAGARFTRLNVGADRNKHAVGPNAKRGCGGEARFVSEVVGDKEAAAGIEIEAEWVGGSGWIEHRFGVDGGTREQPVMLDHKGVDVVGTALGDDEDGALPVETNFGGVGRGGA